MIKVAESLVAVHTHTHTSEYLNTSLQGSKLYLLCRKLGKHTKSM